MRVEVEEIRMQEEREKDRSATCKGAQPFPDVYSYAKTTNRI